MEPKDSHVGRAYSRSCRHRRISSNYVDSGCIITRFVQLCNVSEPNLGRVRGCGSGSTLLRLGSAEKLPRQKPKRSLLDVVELRRRPWNENASIYLSCIPCLGTKALLYSFATPTLFQHTNQGSRYPNLVSVGITCSVHIYCVTPSSSLPLFVFQYMKRSS